MPPKNRRKSKKGPLAGSNDVSADNLSVDPAGSNLNLSRDHPHQKDSSLVPAHVLNFDPLAPDHVVPVDIVASAAKSVPSTTSGQSLIGSGIAALNADKSIHNISSYEEGKSPKRFDQDKRTLLDKTPGVSKPIELDSKNLQFTRRFPSSASVKKSAANELSTSPAAKDIPNRHLGAHRSASPICVPPQRGAVAPLPKSVPKNIPPPNSSPGRPATPSSLFQQSALHAASLAHRRLSTQLASGSYSSNNGSIDRHFNGDGSFSRQDRNMPLEFKRNLEVEESIARQAVKL